MKKLFSLFLLFLVTCASAAEKNGISVGTNPVVIVGMASVYDANVLPEWRPSHAYTINNVIKSGGRPYVCAVAGTSGTNAPSGTGYVQDGSVTWRSMLLRRREGMLFVNAGSSPVYLSFTYPPVVGGGLLLNASGGSASFVNIPLVYQGAVYAISSGTNGLLTVIEY